MLLGCLYQQRSQQYHLYRKFDHHWTQQIKTQKFQIYILQKLQTSMNYHPHHMYVDMLGEK